MDCRNRIIPGCDNHVPDILLRRGGLACVTGEKSFEPEFLYALKSIQETDWPKFYVVGEEQWPPVYKDLLKNIKINLWFEIHKFSRRSKLVIKLKKSVMSYLLVILI